MHQRSRFSASDASYHSFNDIELFEPPSPPRHITGTTTIKPAAPPPAPCFSDHSIREPSPPPASFKMQRQDSGYESYNPSPRNSTSQSRRSSVSRRKSSGGDSSSAHSAGTHQRTRTRPCTRRSAKSYSYTQPSQQPLYLVRPANTSSMHHQQLSYFHFPSPEPPTSSDLSLDEQQVSPTSTALMPSPGLTNDSRSSSGTSSALPSPPLPQTTHYWTSDKTRRLEYAAIDAASRGVKGWIRRNIVPDCFVPQESRHVAFDDDTGSVRRYRLELENEEDEQKQSKKRRWTWWPSKKTTA